MRINCFVIKVLIILISNTKQLLLKAECGLPAIPETTKLSEFKGRYEENTVISYECEEPNSILVGGKSRQCVDHRWIGSLPRCAKQIFDYNFLERIEVKELELPLSVYREMKFSTPGPTPKPRRLGKIVNNVRKFSQCLATKYLWNVNHSQIWSFQIKKGVFFQYFELYMRGGSLLENHNQQKLQLSATYEYMAENRLCQMERFLFIKDSNNYKIGFICDKFGQTSGAYEGINEYTTKIKIEAKVTGVLNITTIFCDLKLYFIETDSCGSPEMPLNSVHLVKDRGYSVFSCRDGFQLIGQQKVNCNPEGLWIDDFPTCKPLHICKIPAFDLEYPNLRVQYKPSAHKVNNTLYAEPDDIAIYSCFTNYTNGTQLRMEGPNIRVCKTGKWTGSQPICQQTNDSKVLRMLFPLNGNSSKSLSTSPTKVFIIVMAMFGSFFVGGVCVAVVLYSVIRRKRRSNRRPNISIIIDENDDNDNERQRPEYESLRVSQCSRFSNEVFNPLYEDFEKYGKTLNIPLDETESKKRLND